MIRRRHAVNRIGSTNFSIVLSNSPHPSTPTLIRWSWWQRIRKWKRIGWIIIAH